VAYFLKHWAEIKKSDNMTQIWQQIRLGKHIGFEEGESSIRQTPYSYPAEGVRG
jgi:hypothetical protein